MENMKCIRMWKVRRRRKEKIVLDTRLGFGRAGMCNQAFYALKRVLEGGKFVSGSSFSDEPHEFFDSFLSMSPR